jgi:hypothetical protein
MIKKWIMVLAAFLTVAAVYAGDEGTPAEVTATATAVPGPANTGKLSITYSSGIYINSNVNTSGTGMSIRFWPSAGLGLEVPLTGSFTSFASDTQQSFNWSIATGANFLFPLQNNSGVNFYFEPGITVGLKSTLDKYIDDPVFNPYSENDDYTYAWTGIITAGFEAEIFLDKIINKFPANVSIGGKISLNGGFCMHESWSGFHYPGHITNTNFSRVYYSGFNVSVIGNTLTGVNIRYYF